MWCVVGGAVVVRGGGGGGGGFGGFQGVIRQGTSTGFEAAAILLLRSRDHFTSFVFLFDMKYRFPICGQVSELKALEICHRYY